MRRWHKALHHTLVAGLLTAAAPALSTPPSSSPSALQSREANLRARFGDATIARFTPGSADTSVPRSLTGLSVATSGTTLRDRAERFLRANADLFALSAGTDVKATDHTSFARAPGPMAKRPGHVVRLRQTYAGLPVEGRDVVVSLDADHRVTSVQSDLGPLVVPTPTRSITAEEATRICLSTFVIAATGAPQKVVLANGTAGRIAWRVPVSLLPLNGFHTVWVDVEDGRILREAKVGHDHGLATLPRQPHAVEAE